MMSEVKDINFIHFEIEMYIQNTYNYTSAHKHIQYTYVLQTNKNTKENKNKKAVINAHFKCAQVAKLVIVYT